MRSLKSSLSDKFERYSAMYGNSPLNIPREYVGYKPIPAFNAEFTAHACVPHKPLEADEVAAIDTLMETTPASEEENNYRRYIHRVVTARFDNLTNPALQSINFVSVGSDCLPRTLFSKYGLRPTRALGEKTLPLDLVSAGTEGTLRILREDFKGYRDPAQLQIAEGFDAPINWSYPICFNHETGTSWRENGYAKLTERYETREKRFRATLANGNLTFIVLNWQRTKYTKSGHEELLEVASLLAERTAGRMRMLCCISTPSDEQWHQPFSERVAKNATVTRVYNPKPNEDYEFYKPELYASPRGVQYENGFIHSLQVLVDIESGAKLSIGEEPPT